MKSSMRKDNKKAKSANGARGTVSATLLRQWKLKREHGDIEIIHDRTGLAKGTISNAFKGLATRKVVDKINQYFS